MRRVRVQTGISFILAALVVLGLAPAAAAQSVTDAGTVSVSPFLGVSFGSGNGVGNSLGLGVGVGYDFSSNLGIEGEFGHVFDVAGDNGDLDWSLTNFSGNVLYHFDVRGPVAPYATFGLGWERSAVDVTNPDPLALVLYVPSSTEFAWNFGGGAKYRISNRLLARGDLRRFQANDLAPDHWRLYGGLTFEVMKR